MHFPLPWVLLLLAPMFQASRSNGIKMTTQFGLDKNSNRRTVYIASDRKRMEFQNTAGKKKADGSLQLIYGPRIVAIIRCDLGQMFELNLDTSEYTAAPYPSKPLTKEQIEARGLQSPEMSAKSTLRIEVNTTDTAERKEMFGHIARHVITTRKQTRLAGSRSEPQEAVTDGWYIDLDQRLSCDYHWPQEKKHHAYTLGVSGKHPQEKVEFVATGESETGFPLQSVTTSKLTYPMPDGTRKETDSRIEMLVTQLEEGSLDPALFEIPPGFKHVQRIERDPMPSAFSRIDDLWQRVKTSVARFFSP